MSPSDVLTRAARPPDQVLRYGPGREQFADLRLPVWSEGAESSPGSAAEWRPEWPVVIFLHGGFWRVAFDRTHTGPLAEALTSAGFAVCTPEYRRTGQPGGGWPGTFDDVAAAVDALPGLVAAAAAAAGGRADLGRVVLAGHSAGGHLALWAAGRGALPEGGRWAAGVPGAGVVPVAAGVVSLAGVCDLAECFRLGLGGDAAGALMGGGPDRYPERYRAADPMGLLPTGIRARLVHGSADDRVPVELSLEYAERGRDAGDDVTCEVLAGCGHFEVIDPRSGAWAAVVAAFWEAAGEGGEAGPGGGGFGATR
jgi:acetyl esterase/lipase